MAEAKANAPGLFGLPAAHRARRGHGLLIVALALWVPLVGIIAVAVLRAREARVTEAEASIAGIAHNVSVAVDAAFRTQVTSLTALARSLPQDGRPDPGVIAERGRVAAQLLGGTLLLYGPPPEDALLANTSDEPEVLRARVAAGALTEATAAMVERIRRTGQPALSDLFVSPVRPRPLVSLGVPLGSALPGMDGAGMRLHLAFEPVVIRELLAEMRIPPGVRVTIRDRRFHVVASSDPTRQPGPPRNFLWAPERLGAAPRGIFTGPDGDGVEQLIAIERLDTDPGWTVVVAQPWALASVGQVVGLGWPVAGGGLLVLGIGGVAWAARADRRRYEEAEMALLRDAQAEVARLHESLPVILVLRHVTRDGLSARMLYRAGDAEQVLGWPAGTLGDDAIGTLAESPEDLQRFRLDTIRDGQSRMDLRIRQPDGGWRWVRLSARRLEPLPGGDALTVGYVVDISAERAAQVQAQAAGRLSSMTDMAHGLAHELKQPLQAAMLQAGAAGIHAQSLRAVPEPLRPTLVALESALEGSMNQISRTGRLIEHLRRFARGPEEGAAPEPVVVADALDDALVLVRRGLNAAEITLDVELGGALPAVLGHRIGLEQILINLLNNARDALAARPPGAPRRIRVTVALAGGRVRLEVADTAGGIPEHIIGQVFDPLVTTKGVEEGTGLGLAICRSLARDMGAEITVRNGPEGAVFTLDMAQAPEPKAVAA